MVKIVPKLLILLLIGVNCFSGGTVSAVSENNDKKVQSVEVQLIVSGNVYEGLQDRIEYSVGRVGEKILLSQPLSLLQQNKETVKTAISKVFSKVLTGFNIDSVELLIDEHTRVVIQLTPVPPLIAKVKLSLEVKGLAPEFNEITDELNGKIEAELNQILVGLPVASGGWSAETIKLVVNYLVEREYPGYSYRFDVATGIETNFRVVLTPVEPLIHEVDVHYVSDDIPTWFVNFQNQTYRETCSLMTGLPIEFVTHYQTRIEKLLMNSFVHSNKVQQWGMSERLTLKPGVETVAKLEFISKVIQTKLEARYFIGSKRSFGNLYTYLGYRNNDFELFARKFWIDYPEEGYKYGIKFPMSPNLSGAIEFNPVEDYKDLRFEFQFDRGDYLQLSFGLEHSPNEALVGIKLNDSTNLEFLKYDHLFGVQVMFHF